jgi:beta-N-acetylhexosaminidase
MSSRVLDGLLREGLGFDGVVVSDALDMAGASAATGIPEAAVRALIAGCDLLCIGPDNTDEQLAEIERAVAAAVDAGRLPTSRLATAASRVAALADRVELPARGRDTASEAPGPDFTLDQVAGQFDVSATARRVLQGGTANRWTVVCLETTRNIAAGVVPWGPRAAAAAGDADWPGEVVSVDEQTASAALRDRGDSGIVLVGQANHRHGWVRDLADRERAAGPTVVVDMGWPSDDRRYADVATYGASRLLGAALLHALDGLLREGGRAA